jgi:hypothetical protein
MKPAQGKMSSRNGIGIYGLRKGQNNDVTAVVRYGFGYIQLFVFEY